MHLERGRDGSGRTQGLDGRCRRTGRRLRADRFAGRQRQPPRRPGHASARRGGHGAARLPPAPRRAGPPHRAQPDHRARRVDPRDGGKLPDAAGGGGCRGRPRLRPHGRHPRRGRHRRRLRTPARPGCGRRDRAERGHRGRAGSRLPGRPRPRRGGLARRRPLRRRADRSRGARPRRRPRTCSASVMRRSGISRVRWVRSRPPSESAGGARRWRRPAPRCPKCCAATGPRHPDSRRPPLSTPTRRPSSPRTTRWRSGRCGRSPRPAAGCPTT